MYIESRLRSFSKAFSWRFFGSAATAALVYAFTGRGGVALTVGGLEAAAKIVIYFVHERLWEKSSFGRREIHPAVVWFTGLPGAGKSTLASRLHERLKQAKLKVEYLDGDTVRNLFPKTGFSREEREEHVRRVGHLASRLEANGVFVVAAFVSPYRSGRDFVRGLCRNYVEVHVATPLSECESRDPKGLYRRARSGELKHFTGVDDAYETPLDPEITVDTRGISVDEALDRILHVLEKRVGLELRRA